MIAQCLLFVFILHHFWLISAMSYWNIRDFLPTWNLQWNHHFYCFISRMTVRSLLFKYRPHTITRTHTHTEVSVHRADLSSSRWVYFTLAPQLSLQWRQLRGTTKTHQLLPDKCQQYSGLRRLWFAETPAIPGCLFCRIARRGAPVSLHRTKRSSRVQVWSP